eukprot:CAMPEP_0119200888 /NCGR_PEP_ID=MMETSP1316-20130426/27521_1 /TAXON_ID=41880 /ORGANISM="Pycnococcus provasolii, Strain RCC2336" /LENGTH=60 /DNA_ID=CAMNT_0007196973 /DNA_START=112 /DNA_END=294 /DNA_ORIENTATION=+
MAAERPVLHPTSTASTAPLPSWTLLPMAFASCLAASKKLILICSSPSGFISFASASNMGA